MTNKVRIIVGTILEMDKPFSISDLFYKLAEEHNITDRRMILDVLDSLLDSGLVNYGDISNGDVSYISPAFTAA